MNLPLFSNEERALVGTTYASEGREQATRTGLDLIGPRMNEILDTARKLVGMGPVLVHCWRGGMRSESVAWLLNFSGEFEATTLRGGYKAFRKFVHDQFATARTLCILGGMTGSGKTKVLAELRELGEQVIDLERLANHKGSAFGAIGLDSQPTQQQFENDLGVTLSRTDPARRLWLEDESRRIGRCMLPSDLWSAMRQAPCLVLERSKEERIRHLVAGYGEADAGALVASVRRIERRLGGADTVRAVDSIEAGDLDAACEILLDYYDKTYSYGLSLRHASNVHRLSMNHRTPSEMAINLAKFVDALIEDQ